MERVVEALLQTFIQDHLSDEGASTEIDDVLLTYLTGILDGIASGEAEDDFDVDEFADMMSAYVPGFDSIDRTLVYEWIFAASSSLKEPITSENRCVGDDVTAAETSSNQGNNEAANACPSATTSGVAKHSPTPGDGLSVGGLSLSDAGSADGKPAKRRERKTKAATSRQTSVSDQRVAGDAAAAVSEPSSVTNDENSLMLQDMFPATGLDAIHSALLRGDGVLEQAISLLLEEQSDQVELPARKDTARSSAAAAQPGAMSRSPPVRGGLAAAAAPRQDDSAREESARLKEMVLGKYLLVDEAEDERSHRPHMQVAAKNKQKTMYRENHVVSTKGERYTMVAKKEQDEESVKKTYVNLKPLRKYRFH